MSQMIYHQGLSICVFQLLCQKNYFQLFFEIAYENENQIAKKNDTELINFHNTFSDSTHFCTKIIVHVVKTQHFPFSQ